MDNKKIYRETWAEIDLNAIEYNVRCIRSLIKKDISIMSIVKANAYGHGICEVSKVLINNNIDYLGVATVDEALKIRNKGFTKIPILVLGSVLKEEAKIAIQNNITLTVSDNILLQTIIELAHYSTKKIKIHIKIDTGMGRIGIWHENAISYIKHIYKRKKIEVEGMYTHFSSAARDKIMTENQIKSFYQVIKELKENNINIQYKHAANSIAIVDWEDSHLNMVRTGILLYGVYPKEEFRKYLKLMPVMSLKTKIVYLKDTPPGRAISYGRTYITQKHTKIATIPIGYADGYTRILSNKAEALLHGQYVRVVGMVTMDQTLLDVGHINNVKVGDEIVLIGKQLSSEIPVEKIAKLSGTIPYEILSGITERVKRVYKK